MKVTTLLMAAALLTARIGLPVMAGTGPGIPGHSITGAIVTMSAKCKNPQCNPKSPHCKKLGCKPGSQGGYKGGAQ
ncbi:MAG: hypothetical protein ACYCUV_00730 [Phycisphaerae bacterium]